MADFVKEDKQQLPAHFFFLFLLLAFVYMDGGLVSRADDLNRESCGT